MARRKNHPTYDSKETRTIIGLLCILLAIFFAISVFTVSSQNDIFAQARNLFGQSTILTVVFLASLGLFFIDIELPFNTPKSLIAQAILVFIIPAFLTSFATGQFEISRYAEDPSKVPGGTVGLFIVKDIMQETLPTQPGTKIILFLVTLIFLPIALSLSVSEIIERLGDLINWIRALFESDEEEEIEEAEKASTYFGDFNKLKQKNIQDEKDEREEEKKMMHKDLPAIPAKAKFQSQENVEVKEGELGEDGLSQQALKFPDWKLPPLSLLYPYKKGLSKEPAIEQNARVIEQTLSSFGIEAKVEESYVGPSVIQYALNIPLGTKVEKIIGLSANIALALGVDSKAVRIESIPETTYLGIEVPRTKRDMVRFKELMESEGMQQNKMGLPVTIGKDIDGTGIIADIQKMPHLLIAGATGSGKSVLTNSFISSILMKRTPDEVRFILVDPKQVELSDYNGIPHLLAPVITDMKEVVNALNWLVREMEKRYTNLAREQVRNIIGYNEKKGFAAMPYIVVVIDEMADMMMTANRVEAETAIVRLAQKARAVGIHLILATQRPSVNVITGIIKANIPGRVGMSVTSSTDSRVILDRIGAESLLGYGDLLYKAPDKPKSNRLQGSFIEQEEVIRIVDFIKSQAPEVEYVNEITKTQATDGDGASGDYSADGSIGRGSLVEQAIRIAVQYNKGSSSFLQRKLNIGFNKAAELVEELEMLGVVGPQNGSKPREVLISDAEAFLAEMKGGE